MIDLLREYWDWFLLDTLLWTGGLIALVLVLRRPVSRHLGPGAAYALWALPALRLLLPPITLPAWMEPVPAMPADSAAPPIALAEADPGFLAMASMPAPPLPEPTDFVTPLALMWLAGAVFFLVRRFWLYGELRKELLEDAVPVGESGKVRLIETPAISGPMAFGVIDKVIALPSGFMTSRDRQSRDLAIAHELEHHRGHDLLANILVQPLFAAHWFNPLGWMGWTALRRDQEAWCDARVVATRPREERAAYAGVIADFARRPQIAPRPALAAPMACPVLGDKSIIHRLRNLSMSDVSKRRRFAGRAGIAAALFALPMTATVCYSSAIAAAPEPVQPPEAPAAPLPPAPPLAPEPPAAPEAPEFEREMADLDRELAEAEKEIARAELEIERELGDAKKKHVHTSVVTKKDGKRHVERHIVRSGHEVEMSAEEREVLRRELKEQLAEVRKQLAEDGEIRREMRWAMAEAHAQSESARAEALANAPRVVVECRDKINVITTDTDKQGKTTMFLCEANADRMAVEAMKSARKAIKTDRNLSKEERAEALRALDEAIKEHSR